MLGWKTSSTAAAQRGFSAKDPGQVLTWSSQLGKILICSFSLKSPQRGDLPPKSSVFSVLGCRDGFLREWEVGEDAFGSSLCRWWREMLWSIVFPGEAPEKHPCNLKQDWQEKLSKSGKNKWAWSFPSSSGHPGAVRHLEMRSGWC